MNASTSIRSPAKLCYSPGHNSNTVMHPIDKKLQELNIKLPEISTPAGDYLPVTQHDGLLFVSGQFPKLNGELLYQGQVGDKHDIESACQAAKLAALNVLSHLRASTNNWRQFGSLIRLEGHIASAPGWYEQPKVLDAASKLFKQVLGLQGQHSRTAFAPEQLPLNAMVELVVTARQKF